MRHRAITLVLAAVFVAMAPLGAQAQDDKKFSFTLSGGYTYTSNTDYVGGQYGDAILTKPSIRSHRMITLPFTPSGQHEPRGLCRGLECP